MFDPDSALDIFSALPTRDLQRTFMQGLMGGHLPASDRPRNRTASSKGSSTMPTATTQTAAQKRAAAAAAAKAKANKGAAKPKAAAKKPAAKTAAVATETADGVSKREAQKVRDAELTTRILEMREGDSKWGEIAAELNITSGKAQYLIMLHEVAEGTVPAITFRNDTEKVARIKKAREANDAYSSWGWLSARTGISEGTLKTFMSEHMDVKGTNVAVARSATATNGEAKIGAAAKPAAAKAASAAAKAKAAKAAAKRPS